MKASKLLTVLQERDRLHASIIDGLAHMSRAQAMCVIMSNISLKKLEEMRQFYYKDVEKIGAGDTTLTSIADAPTDDLLDLAADALTLLVGKEDDSLQTLIEKLDRTTTAALEDQLNN